MTDHTQRAEAATFSREGDYWTIAHGGTVSRLRDTKGLGYISWLLSHPGQEFHVLDLVHRVGRVDSADQPVFAADTLPIGAEELANAGIHFSDLGDAGEMLDDQARLAYRRRITELHGELEEARKFSHQDRAARIEDEIDALTSEISRAVGLGGRRRRSASAAERARQSATHAIKTALERIAENNPTLGQKFTRTIRTGVYCSYQPEPGEIAWDLGTAPADTARTPGAGAPDTRDPDGMSPVITLQVTQSLANQAGFVGRETERTLLRQITDHALSGHGAVVMVGGGPGVGKTRLAMEAAAYAESRGFRSFIGRCYERDEPYPYLPFAEIFETMLAQVGRDDFRRLLGDNAAELAQLAPRLRRIFADIPASGELPPQQTRRYLFQSLGEYLARSTRRAPLFLVLDDLHWADESTLALVNFLAHRVEQMPMVIVGTYRDGEADSQPALTRTLEELLRFGIRPLNLRGLSLDAVTLMLRELSLREPPDSMVRLIFSETEGNPFFVTEVYKYLVEEGRVFDDAGNFRRDIKIGEVDVPGNVRLVLGRRVARLSEETRRILIAAAVIGGRFSVKLLQALVESHDLDDLLAAAEEAQRMGLLASHSEESDAAFTFAHELVRQTLLSEVSQHRRQHLHLNAARAIEALYSHELDERAAEIANHLIKAGSLADGQKIPLYLGMAGKNALQGAAYEEAHGHLSAALTYYKSADSPRRADLLLDLAAAARGLGNWSEAFSCWNQAIDLYTAAGDSQATGCVFFDLFEGLVWSGRDRDAETLAQRGVSGLKKDPANRAYLNAVLGLMHSLKGRHGPAAEAFGEALGVAREIGDRKLVARIHAYRAVSDFYFLQLQDALANGRAAADLGQSEGSPWSRAIGLSRLQVSFHHLGRDNEAQAVTNELQPLARKIGHFGALSFSDLTQAWMDFARDPDLDRLYRGLAADVEFSRATKTPLLLAPGLAQLSVVEFLRANQSAALDYAEQALKLSPFPVMLGFGAGAMFRPIAYAGDRQRALDLLEKSRAKLPRAGEANTLGSWAMLLPVVEGLYVMGEWAAAANFYDLIIELIGTGTICMGWIARFPQTIAGVAAAAGRRFSAAEEHFSIALRQAEQVPHLPEVADLHRFHAMMLIERRQPGDLSKARQLLAEARQIYERIGMPRHIEITSGLASGLPISEW
jgi:tetratricopeptide (TPR) repeat protein